MDVRVKKIIQNLINPYHTCLWIVRKASLSNFNSENIFLMKKLTLGGSTGGDVEIGRQVIEKDASKLRVILEVVDLVIIIGGLGGGLASGAI